MATAARYPPDRTTNETPLFVAVAPVAAPDVAVAAARAAPPALEGAQQCDRRPVAAGEVDGRETAARRWRAWLASDRHPAGERLHHVVVAFVRRPRPVHAEARE